MHFKTLLFLSVAWSGQIRAQSNGIAEGTDGGRPGTRFEVGVWTGGFVSLSGGDVYYAKDNLYGVLGGLSARLRFSDNHRLGFELAAYHGATGQRRTEVKDWAGWETQTTNFRQTSTTVGLQVQVHPGRDGDLFRPLFGAGFGIVGDRYIADQPLKSYYESDRIEMRLEPMLKLESGWTLQVDKRWKITQAFYYRYDLSYAGSAAGLRFGVFYSL